MGAYLHLHQLVFQASNLLSKITLSLKKNEDYACSNISTKPYHIEAKHNVYEKDFDSPLT